MLSRGQLLAVVLFCSQTLLPGGLLADTFTVMPRSLDGKPIPATDAAKITIQAFKHQRSLSEVRLAQPTQLTLPIVNQIPINIENVSTTEPNAPLILKFTIDANDTALTGIGVGARPERTFFLAFTHTGQVTSISSFLAVSQDNTGSNLIDIVVPQPSISRAAPAPCQTPGYNNDCGVTTECCRKCCRKNRCRRCR